MQSKIWRTDGCQRAVEQGEVALLRDLVYWAVDGNGAIIQHADLRDEKNEGQDLILSRLITRMLKAWLASLPRMMKIHASKQ